MYVIINFCMFVCWSIRPWICFCFNMFIRIQRKMKGILIGLSLFILCVWLYIILSLKHSGVSWIRSKRCTCMFHMGM